MPTAADPIHVYIDGSDTTRSAYGWVLANATGSMTLARAVEVERNGAKRATGYCTRMEVMAFIDALWEFAPRNRHIVIHGDCQYLAGLIEKYRDGASADIFFENKNIPYDHAQRLLSLMRTVSFEFQWVKGHSGDRYNCLVDSMLRRITVKGQSEATATAYAKGLLRSFTLAA